MYVIIQTRKLACKRFRVPYSNFDSFFVRKTAARKRRKKSLIFKSLCYNNNVVFSERRITALNCAFPGLRTSVYAPFENARSPCSACSEKPTNNIFRVIIQARKLACKGFQAPYSNFDAFFARKTAALKRRKKIFDFCIAML